MSDQPDQPVVYAVRVSEYAIRELEQILIRINDVMGNDQAALEWFGGFYRIVGALAHYPKRYAVQPHESRIMGRDIRREIYRNSPSTSAPYNVFYTVRDESEDGPIVTITHIRHASRKPITRAEAKDILAGQ